MTCEDCTVDCPTRNKVKFCSNCTKYFICDISTDCDSGRDVAYSNDCFEPVGDHYLTPDEIDD